MSVERGVAMHRQLGWSELAPHAIRLLAAGEPVPLARLGGARPLEAACLELDEQGRLVGLMLTLLPTPHRFLLDGRTLYGWCASDTLMFPVILGRPGVVESRCPATREPVRIELAPGRVLRCDPPRAVVTTLRPAGEIGDVRAAVCRHGNFYASPAAPAQWASEHPDGEVRPVAEAFAADRECVLQLGWAA